MTRNPILQNRVYIPKNIRDEFNLHNGDQMLWSVKTIEGRKSMVLIPDPDLGIRLLRAEK